MERIKIGYLPLFLKMYDDTDPHYRDEPVSHMHMLIGMLERENLEVVRADVCRVEAEFMRAIDMFNAENVDAIVTQHLAYSPSLECIEALKRAKAPIIVFDTTPDYELIAVSGYKSCVPSNHGIHGVQDMCSMLKRCGVPFEIRAGHAAHSPIVSEIAGLCRAAAVKKRFQTARVGSVGGTFTGMGDFAIQPEDFKRLIGADVIFASAGDMEHCVSQVSDAEVSREIALDKSLYTCELHDEQAYAASVKAGLALRRWAEAERLTALTVNFLTLDKYGLPKMPFIECSKAMARGLGYAGEGDVLTAALVGALRGVYYNTTFTEIFCPDWKRNAVMLSHMGECNLALAKWKPVLANVPFDYNSLGDSAAAYACLRPGQAVLVNLAPMNERFSLTLAPVEMLDEGLEFGVYRHGMQGYFKPQRPLADFLREYSLIGGTHHSALVYDVNIEELASFGRMMDFDVATID